MLGVLREARAGFRVVPVDRKSAQRICRWTSAIAAGAKHNELVLCEPMPAAVAGFPRVRVVERIGSMDSPKTISLIAIHAHGIPDRYFRKSVLDEAKAREAGRSARAHRSARHSAGHHRSGRCPRP